MPHAGPGAIRLLLIGAPASEFRLAAVMARDAGAEVVAADSIGAALAAMRADGADIAMVDVAADVAGFIAQLRRERMALPVYACGVDAPASRAVAAIRAGAHDYLPLPPDRDLIAAVIVSVAGNARVLIGDDPALVRAVELGLALATARAPFLIAGEPGSGRELLARTIHAASGRRGRFVAVDCAETDPTMMESELFGHDVGEFPGAVAHRRGRLDAAAEGTLFLSEVALLPLAVQTRLARRLESEAEQVSYGSALSARVIASTALNLDARIGDGRFRASLLAQLGLVRLAVPPLRERGNDVPLLAGHFVHRFSAANGLPVRGFTDAALAILCSHDWPGNVSELEDVVHRAVLISHDACIPAAAITLADGSSLDLNGRARRQPRVGRNGSATGLDSLVGSTVEDVERALILETLKACRGNRTSASTILGISVRTMRNKLKSFIEAGITIAPSL